MSKNMTRKSIYTITIIFDAVTTLVNFEMLWDKKNDKPTPQMLELMKVANLL